MITWLAVATETNSIARCYQLFRDFQNGWGASVSTMVGYDAKLKHLFDWLDLRGVVVLDEVTPELLDGWAADMREQTELHRNNPFRRPVAGTLSPATIAGRIRCVKTFFRFCHERGYSQTNPAGHLRQPKQNHSARSRIMSRDDFRAMLRLAQSRPGHRDLAMLMFAADTGARRGEIASLQIRYLDFDKLDATVWGKTGEGLVDFTQATAMVLKLWLSERPQTGHDFVFVGVDKRRPDVIGRPLNGGGVYQIFQRLGLAAGVTGRCNPQALRHLVGQSWADMVNLELVRQKLRHTNITTTAMFYAHQDRSRVKAATILNSLV